MGIYHSVDATGRRETRHLPAKAPFASEGQGDLARAVKNAEPGRRRDT
jgi:hypothetical protein